MGVWWVALVGGLALVLALGAGVLVGRMTGGSGSAGSQPAGSSVTSDSRGGNAVNRAADSRSTELARRQGIQNKLAAEGY